MNEAFQTVSSLAVLSVMLLFVHGFSHGEPVPLRAPLATFPATVGRWHAGESTTFSDAILAELRVSDYLMRRYEDPDGRSLWLYVGFWDSQRHGAQMHSPKHCLPGAGWEPLQADRVAIRAPGTAHPIEANRYVVQNGAAQQVVVYWFQSLGIAVAGELESKIQLLRNSVFHRRTDAAIVRISAPVARRSIAEATDDLVEYAEAALPELQRLLPD